MSEHEERWFAESYIGDDALPFFWQMPLHVPRRQQITGNREERKKGIKVRKFVIFILVSLKCAGVLVFYRMIVFSRGSAELQSISSANYDQRTGTRLFPAHKLAQTQLYKSSLLANVWCVCVDKDKWRSVRSKRGDTGRIGRRKEINWESKEEKEWHK